MENLLRFHLDAGIFLFSAELVLGRDHRMPEAEEFVRDASGEPSGVRIIGVTDLPGGSPALPPEAFIPYVQGHGLTPLAHLSGKDGNRSSLEARLHALARMGAENVLALTGDAQKRGLEGSPKPVYDLDSVLILSLISAARKGVWYQRGVRSLSSTPFGFLPGAVVNPYKVREADQMMQLYKMELKIAAGARFIITQLGFDLRKLYELRQYMMREGLGHVPVIANVYLPTLHVARVMQRGDIPGCVVTDELARALEGEKKGPRLERAALMVAAARDLGFAGAHLGGFGLTHRDVMAVMERSCEVGAAWRGRVEELLFGLPGQFHLLPQGPDGLSAGDGAYQTGQPTAGPSWRYRLSAPIHRALVAPGSPGTRLLRPAADANGASGEEAAARPGLRSSVLGLGNVYRRMVLGCAMCGDCIQDHLNFPGCTMKLCYKELRNGPCGGSRVDGSCEVDAKRPCVWNLAYVNTRAIGDDPRKFGRTLVPPRDWALNGTNALANRLAGRDNYSRRMTVEARRTENDDQPAADTGHHGGQDTRPNTVGAPDAPVVAGAQKRGDPS